VDLHLDELAETQRLLEQGTEVGGMGQQPFGIDVGFPAIGVVAAYVNP
jgi:hypothetical protein